ncbi:MAG: lysylphosphatidylglycerol synthase transmembrane domain-containing protein [Allorhizobium sp.]
MSAASRPRSRRYLSFGLRLVLTIVLLGMVLRNMDFGSIKEGLQGNLGPALALSFGLLLFALALSSLRWILVSRIIGVNLELANAVPIVLIGHFFNQLLPTSFGGDAMRGWCLWRQGTTLQQSFASVLFDRLVGLVALILLVVAGLPLLGLRLGTPLPLVLSVSIVIAGAIGLILLFNLHRVPDSVRRLRVWSLLEKLSDYTRKLLKAPAISLTGLTLSLAVHASALYTTAIISDALGAPLPMIDALLIVPTVLVLTALPLSIGGWGIREVGLAGGFTLLGFDPSVAVTTSVLFGAINIAGGILGGLVFVAMGRPGPIRSEDVS